MILVTLGTQDKSFKRLLDLIQKEIDNKNIEDEVIVQAGYTKYDSKDMKIFDYIEINKFDNLIKKCDILITHAGVGSIITGLKNNKIVIAVPRLKKYKEHTNDHQIQIVESLKNDGYILSLNENELLKDVLNKAKTFKPKKYISNNSKIKKLVTDFIDNN